MTKTSPHRGRGHLFRGRDAAHLEAIKMPKGYIVGHVTVTNPEAYKEYVRLDTPVLEKHGARFLVRGGASDTVEGESLERHIVFEFDSYEAAEAAYYDPEYQEIAKIRKENSQSVIILVEGV